MISQRDINAFFTVLDVLANPEKAKGELKVLADMRASVDEDLKRVGEESQKALTMVAEARKARQDASEMLTQAKETEELNAGRWEQLKGKEKEVVEVAKQNQEINRLLDLREKEVADRERVFIEKMSRYETSLADYNVRNEALRKKEAEYRERMEKLKQITN